MLFSYINNDISGTHAKGLVAQSWACSLRNFLKKVAIWCVLMFLCILAILRPTRHAVPSHICYMRPNSGPFLSFLAYYMGAPSDQFLRIEYGGPSDQFLRL